METQWFTHYATADNISNRAEKAQDNISNRATAEKEPSTHEKDKEDQNIISSIQNHLF